MRRSRTPSRRWHAPGPTLTNDAGTDCLAAGPTSFTLGFPYYFWSSTTLVNYPPFGRAADLHWGYTFNMVRTNALPAVWPVRAGR